MAKKMLKKKVQRKPAAAKAAAPIMDSAREIWLAGLGAFSVAQQESGRIIEHGSKLFDKLVAEGSKMEKKTRKDVEGAVEDLRSEMDSRVAGLKQQAEVMRKQATDNWDKLEKIFEDRVARATASLGIPGKDQVNKLADKIEKLSRRIAELEARQSASRKTAAKKAASKKAPKKKVAGPAAKSGS